MPARGYGAPRFAPHFTTQHTADMRAWLIHIGEPLPTDGPVRLFRYGLLAEEWLARGGEVVQWAGTFNHFTKQHRAGADGTLDVKPGYSIRLMHGCGYQRHVGIRRLIYHRQIARSFARQAVAAERPDVIIASLPTLELADLAAIHGARHGIPTVVDVRDLWPDVYANALPISLRPLARKVMRRWDAVARRTLTNARSITAVSDSYLQWGLQRAGRARKSHDRVFPHAYRLPAFLPESLSAARAHWDKCGVAVQRSLRCCFFGGFNATSCLEPFLLAMRRLHNAGQSDIELIVCGQGPKQQLYERLANGLPTVRFFGWTDQSELLALADRSDVGLAAYGPGAPQSLPNKPIEYMAAGLAILSTLGGAELETLLRESKSGVTLTEPNPANIAQQLLDWKQNPARLAQLKHAAGKLFHARFDARIVCRQMAEHLEMLARNAARRFDLQSTAA